MKRKNLRKMLLMGLSLVLVAVIAVAGTYAYLQDSTEDVVNTFSSNEVSVGLEETTGDQYNIIPGTEQDKDPKVTVTATLPSYVYLEVTDTANTEDKTLIDYTIDNGWTPLDGYENVYYREFTPSVDDTGKPINSAIYGVLVDDKVYYPASLTNDDMPVKDVTLTFKAYAIQKEPFKNPVSAYSAVNSTEVGTSEEFINALKEGKSVILNNDIEITEKIKILKGSVSVLNLNGKTITSKGGPDRPIENYGTLTVIGNGTIDTTDVKGYGAIRNYGELTIENGTFKGSGLGGGSAIDTWDGGITVINGGNYYATAAIMNRKGGTVIVNGGDFEGVTNGNEQYSNGTWSYAIRNYGTMTINDANVHGSMNGGVACDSGTITINGGYFSVEAVPGSNIQTFYVLVTDQSAGGKIVVTGGNFEQKNGTDRLIGGFNGMPSWDATSGLDANGYTITGGTFIVNGKTVTIGE